MRRHIAVLLMLGLMPWSGPHAQAPAQTATATATFIVKTTVQAVCVVSATELNFGNYSSGSGPLLGTSVVQPTCTPGTTYNIKLNGGSAGGTIYGGRQMASGANKLNYQLYRDSARANIWGETTGTDTVQDIGTGVAKSHTVYGTIPGAQAVPAGAYQDTITVTISF
jgi:spore coat protein U-like protein